MLKSPYKIKHYYPSKVFIPYDNYWNGEYIDPRDMEENKVNKTLHLKRERVDKNKYEFPQGLIYDLTGWTENDIH